MSDHEAPGEPAPTAPRRATAALTPSGWAVAGACLVLAAAGAVANYPELLAIAAACAAALVIAGVWMLSRPDLVAVREITPGRVTEGDGARGVLTLTNVAARRSPPLLAVEAVGDRRVAVPLPSLAPGASHEAAYELPTDRRGLHPVGPLTMARSDPLRLVSAAQEHASQSVLAVHPRIHDVQPVPTGRTRDMDGPTSLSAPQGGIAFHSLRPYVPGDDLRLIHWRSTARTGELMVRHNVVPNEPRVMVVLDTSADPYTDESFEDAVRAAASLCAAACRERFPLRFHTTGGLTAASDRDGHGRAAILDLLAAVARSPDDPGLAQLLDLLPADEMVSLGVVTGQAPVERLAAVSSVRDRFDMVSLVAVGEEFGRPGPAVDGALVVNCGTSDEFALLWNQLVRE